MEAGATKSPVWTIAIEWFSFTLAKALWGPLCVSNASGVGCNTAKNIGCIDGCISLSIALSHWMGKGTNNGKSYRGEFRAGLADESSSTQAKGVSLTLTQAPWGPVAVGGTSGVEASATQSAVWTIAIKWVGGGQGQKR